MSYFSLFGDSLNTALSAVGNIVAPVDEEGLDVGDESRSGRGWGDAFDIAEEDEHDAMEDEGPIALNGDHEDAGEQIRRHGETQNDLASRDGNSYEDVKQLQDALEDRDARIADLQRYNGKLERRVDELEEQVRFLDGKEKSLGIELAEARRAGESAIALARGEKSKVEAELREQLDRSLDEWTRAEERVRELEAALAVALAETELLRAQSNGLSAPAEGNGRSEERLGRAEGENIEAVKAIHNFASLTLKMLENVLSRSPVDVSLQTVLGALGEPSNEESTLLASRLLESIYEVENKVKAAEKGLYQGRSLDASILAPLASALGADASTITDQALVDAACLRLRKEDTNLRTAEAEQVDSVRFLVFFYIL
jgi:chromosome segregation ATPase